MPFRSFTALQYTTLGLKLHYILSFCSPVPQRWGVGAAVTEIMIEMSKGRWENPLIWCSWKKMTHLFSLCTDYLISWPVLLLHYGWSWLFCGFVPQHCTVWQKMSHGYQVSVVALRWYIWQITQECITGSLKEIKWMTDIILTLLWLKTNSVPYWKRHFQTTE